MDTQTNLRPERQNFYMTDKDKLRESTLQQVKDGTLTAGSAADILELSWRQIMRLKKRFKNKGLRGILHTARGKASNQKLPEKKTTKAMKIIKEKYIDFGPTLANEKLAEVHHISMSTESLRQLMIKEKLWLPKPVTQEKYPHTWRARKDNFGEMQQYDGSYYDWFEGRLKDEAGNTINEQCLLAGIDDATGKMTHAEFAASEGVMPTFRFWTAYLENNGKPASIYLDRFSTYKNNIKKNTQELLDPTQFGRAMNQLGIRVIHAHSPQGKGRIERLFQTLQDRLVKELRLKNIFTIVEANKFLQNIFMPAFNRQFAVVPKHTTDAHRSLSAEEKLSLSVICSVQDERIITNNYTVSHNNQLYQIDPRQKTLVRTGDTVIICTKLKGSKTILKHGKALDFTEITARPKQAVVLKTESGRRLGHKPKADHPWRETFIINAQEKELTRV